MSKDVVAFCMQISSEKDQVKREQACIFFREEIQAKKIIQATKKIQATNVSYKNNTGWSERD